MTLVPGKSMMRKPCCTSSARNARHFFLAGRGVSKGRAIRVESDYVGRLHPNY